MNRDGFDYLVGWLYAAVRDEYEGNARVKELAEGSFKPLKGVIAQLWGMFDRRVCEGRDRVFRVGQGELYAYNGKWFERVSEKTFLKELVKRVLARLGVTAVYQLNASPVIARECMDRLANSEECAFEPDRRYVAFRNCVFDVKEGRALGFSLRYCTDIVLDFDYDERASCLLWDAKLKEIIPNAEMRGVLQQFCGSLLAKRSEAKVEYIAYLYGSGSNGKSVLASAIGNMLGERYYSTFTPQQLFKEGNSSMFNMKELQGKVLNICDDLTASDFSGGAMKRFISGEKFKARGAYSKDFAMVEPPLMLVCTNALPDAADDSWGHHRRQLVIHTTSRQWGEGDRDPQLTSKLAAEEARQRIFLWCYEGYRRLMRNKGNIEIPESVAQAQRRRLEDSNPMRRWAAEMGFTKALPTGNDDPRWQRLSDLYARYREWCVANGAHYEADARKIGGMLRSLVVETKVMYGKCTMVCVGVIGVDTDAAGRVIAPRDA